MDLGLANSPGDARREDERQALKLLVVALWVCVWPVVFLQHQEQSKKCNPHVWRVFQLAGEVERVTIVVD